MTVYAMLISNNLTIVAGENTLSPFVSLPSDQAQCWWHSHIVPRENHEREICNSKTLSLSLPPCPHFHRTPFFHIHTITNDNLCYCKLFSPSGLSTWYVLFKSLLLKAHFKLCKYERQNWNGMQREKEPKPKQWKKYPVSYKLTITVVNKQTDDMNKKKKNCDGKMRVCKTNKIKWKINSRWSKCSGPKCVRMHREEERSDVEIKKRDTKLWE